MWHCSLLRLTELGFEILQGERAQGYAAAILRRPRLAQATYLWPYRPTTKHCRSLMAESTPLQALAVVVWGRNRGRTAEI